MKGTHAGDHRNLREVTCHLHRQCLPLVHLLHRSCFGLEATGPQQLRRLPGISWPTHRKSLNALRPGRRFFSVRRIHQAPANLFHSWTNTAAASARSGSEHSPQGTERTPRTPPSSSESPPFAAILFCLLHTPPDDRHRSEEFLDSLQGCFSSILALFTHK